jgi:hypothetical protein
VFVLVDAFGSASGSLTLTPTLEPVAPGDFCSNAELLTLPAIRAADTLVGYFNDYSNGPGCATGTASNERVYVANVPANSRLTAVVSASTNTDGGAAFQPTLNIGLASETCGALVNCVAGANSTATPGTATANFDNGPVARDVRIFVDTGTTIPGGTFTLNVTAAATTLPVGDVCSNVGTALSNGTLQNEAFTGYAGQYASAAQVSCSYLSGLDRAYAVTIPSGQILTATVVATDAGVLPDGGFVNLSLSVVPATNECNTGPCVSGVNATGSPGAPETVLRSNTGSTAENVVLVVDSNLPSAAGTYALTVNVGAPAVGDTCSDSLTAIVAAGNLPGQSLAGYSADYGTGTSVGCRFVNSGIDRVYRITIPASTQLTATTVTPVFADHALSIVDGLAAACASPTTCAASADDDPMLGGETLDYINTTGLPKTVFLIVDRFSGPDAFDLNITFTPFVANTGETCQAPELISSSGTISGQTTSGYLNDIEVESTGACTGEGSTYDGLDRVYQITVGPGQTLTATVTPTSSWDPGLYFVAGPATNCATIDTTCVGTGSDSQFGGIGAGSAETGTFVNSTGSAQDVFIVVDSLDVSSPGDFDLTISLLP